MAISSPFSDQKARLSLTKSAEEPVLGDRWGPFVSYARRKREDLCANGSTSLDIDAVIVSSSPLDPLQLSSSSPEGHPDLPPQDRQELAPGTLPLGLAASTDQTFYGTTYDVGAAAGRAKSESNSRRWASRSMDSERVVVKPYLGITSP